MSGEERDDFWAKIGEAVRLRRPETYWSSQRARIMTRVQSGRPSPVRYWIAVPAMAAFALALFLHQYQGPEDRKADEISRPPAELLSDLDFFLQMDAAQNMEQLGGLEDVEIGSDEM